MRGFARISMSCADGPHRPPSPPSCRLRACPPPAAVAVQAATKATPRFSLLGLNAGLDDTKNLTFTGRGQFFAPFKENFAFQAQGEYMYFRTRKEGQVDFGLVSRWNPVQLGAFASFRNISWREWERTATLGQASFTMDYLFKYGRVGLFGAKGFMDKWVVTRVATTPTFNVWTETYVGIVDQVGASGAVSLGSKAVSKATSATCAATLDSRSRAVRCASCSRSAAVSRSPPRVASTKRWYRRIPTDARPSAFCSAIS